MPTRDVDPAWLPDHQLATAMTLGHADEVAGRLYDLLFDYVQAGALGLANVCDGRSGASIRPSGVKSFPNIDSPGTRVH